MKRTVHFTPENNRRIMSDSAFVRGGSNLASREKMKRILYLALRGELTERQRSCVEAYYFDGKKERQIASELGLNISTVSRHLSTARKKLRRVAAYYVCRSSDRG